MSHATPTVVIGIVPLNSTNPPATPERPDCHLNHCRQAAQKEKSGIFIIFVITYELQTMITTYPTLIDDVCGTKTKSAELVKKIIPILIRWAQQGITSNHYKELINELGYSRYSGIGDQLGLVNEVFNELSKKTGKKYPTLNALCANSQTNLPSDGFNYVEPSYDTWSKETKLSSADRKNKEAINYDEWDNVLTLLGLKPSVGYTKKDERAIRKGGFGGGESQQHKKLKEYICNHPESLGINNVTTQINESVLLSGDKLDVYFELKNGDSIAVEVKSLLSSDDDILRGLYQCVKYKAVMDAENLVHCSFSKCKAILVIEGTLSESNIQVRNSLGINVIENFKY